MRGIGRELEVKAIVLAAALCVLAGGCQTRKPMPKTYTVSKECLMQCVSSYNECLGSCRPNDSECSDTCDLYRMRCSSGCGSAQRVQ